MNETMAERQTTGSPTDKATCTECGQTLSQRRRTTTTLSPPERSEYQEYCPGCYELNAQGERVLVTDTHDSQV